MWSKWIKIDQLPEENSYCVIVEKTGENEDTIFIRQLSATFINREKGFRLDNNKTYIPVNRVLKWMSHGMYPEF